MPMRILVVDDSAPYRELTTICLSLAGYEVGQAADARTALLQIAEAPPDLLLLDVGLPDLSGWDVLRLVRLTEKWKDIPVIMVTGLGDAASMTYGWQLGCACYLTKPVDLDDLLLVVQTFGASQNLDMAEHRQISVRGGHDRAKELGQTA